MLFYRAALPLSAQNLDGTLIPTRLAPGQVRGELTA
jgi:hypothetical protein